jgi:mycothiol maleylpyruvate isomerase-like protein
MPALRPLNALDTAPLFAPLRAELLALLRGLAPEDWDRSTVAGAWRVRDVVAHLLDGELRTLSAHRDGHALAPDDSIQGYADLVALINRLNAEGVATGRHLSARLLVDLLAVTGTWMSDFVAALDPDAPALFAVAWAGEAQSTNRFDTAREYTERWHHQMQIRMAVGERGKPDVLLAKRYAAPLLETAVRVLPYAYRAVEAANGATLELELESFVNDARSDAHAAVDESWSLAWTLRHEASAWRLYQGKTTSPTARVTGSPDAWCRLFFNAMPLSETLRAFTVEGASALISPLWGVRSVMV